MKKILITGGLGFIGRHLADLLIKDGCEVSILDSVTAQVHGTGSRRHAKRLKSEKASLRIGDVRSRSAVVAALKGVDSVVHLAAETGTGQSMYQIAKYNDVNVQGFAVLLDALTNTRTSVRRIVLASSRAIYGEGAYHCARHEIVYPFRRTEDQLKAHEWEPRCPVCGGTVYRIGTPESAPANPASVYAATKYAQELLLKTVAPATGISATSLRFQNVYGPGQSLKNPYTGILSIFSTRIRRNMPISIFEDGAESRDFVHVLDVARAIRLALARNGSGYATYNVGSGVPTSVLEVARLLVAVFNGTVEASVSGQFRLGDIRHCYADISSIRRELGFEPRIALRDGLADFAEWVEKQPLPLDRLEHANHALRVRGMLR